MPEFERYCYFGKIWIGDRLYKQVMFDLSDERIEILDASDRSLMVFDTEGNTFLFNEQRDRVFIGKIEISNRNFVFVPSSRDYDYLKCSRAVRGFEPIHDFQQDIFNKFWERNNVRTK